MAPVVMPQDLDAFAEITEPAERAAIEQKLQRYIARGAWAQEALAKLHHRPWPPGSACPTEPAANAK